MKDLELRNKLASEYSEPFEAFGVARESFKAGWDLARSNQPVQASGATLDALARERDDLNSEVIGLKELCAVQKTYLVAAEKHEQNLRSVTENLAEALLKLTEFIECLYADGPESFSKKAFRELTTSARKSIAEYYEKFPK